MSTTFQRPARARRQALALGTSLALLASAGAFGQTDISDIPMSAMYPVPPNIMFTIDDSHSMSREVLPNFSVGGYELNYLFPPPLTTITDSTAGTELTTDAASTAEEINTVDTEQTNRYARFFRSTAGNPLYYNPNIVYQPWRNADGTPWPDAVITAALLDPNDRTGPSIDLTQPLTLNGSANRLLTNSGVWESVPADGTAVTIQPATYFVYTDTEPLTLDGDNNVETNFKKVEIAPGTPQMQNFANWFTYHRSRTLAARAAIGKAFLQQKPDIRVGYTTINSTLQSGVKPFGVETRTEFLDWLYKHPLTQTQKPLREAAVRVGAYFSTTGTNSPWWFVNNKGVGAELSCFKNFHVLMTDGYWSKADSDPIVVGNADGTAGTNHIHADAQSSYTYSPTHPYQDDHSNTLADVAMHYWKTDLRSEENNVPTDARDPAFWQHLSTYTIGFGVSGTLSKAEIDSAFTRNPLEFTWPDPFAAERAKIDDLAHAAINGRGRFLSTTDADVLESGLGDMLQSIGSLVSASAASAVSNPNVTITDNTTYETSYVPGVWTGDLRAFSLDLNTGAPTTASPWGSSAMTQLDGRTPESRRIATYNGSSGVAFTAGSLSTDQLALLNIATSPEPSNAADVLAYLRGDRSGETTGVFREREHVLGAIIHSEPALVRAPYRGYIDAGYAQFKADNLNRPRMIYVGANDGMMHAFNALTGAEEWAYVPGPIYERLGNLAKLDAGFKATVDGLLSAADVNFANTGGVIGTPDWRTLLVGGLGRGGKGFFALDITAPIPTDSGSILTEADVAAKVLWEFPNASTSQAHKDMLGLSFSRPIIAKTALGWVVLVSSGYNNIDGGGYLFVLNARTGEVIRAIATGVGSSGDPSGLGQLSAWVDNDNTDSTVKLIYGGDLKGNLWRFDLTGTTAASWSSTKLATLTNSSGTPQPITVAPELTQVRVGRNTYNLVAVGTGRYLGESDVPSTPDESTPATQTQSFYVIADKLSRTPVVRSAMVQRTLTTLTDGKRALASTDAAVALDWSKTSGWFIDLNIPGERVNTDPAIAATTIAFVTNVPSADPCTPGGSSHLFQFDLVTGSYARSLTGATFVSSFLGRTLASRPVLIKLPSGKIVALIRKSDGTTIAREILTPQTGGESRRMSWRELTNY